LEDEAEDLPDSAELLEDEDDGLRAREKM